jgi:LytS/YehU family sensor histidine kinase
VEIQRARAVSELALLQAQIEPHFLFNTLAHVLSTVEREPPVAKAMLEHLTRYLRATLRRSRESEHCLAEEIELIEALLAIAAMRPANEKRMAERMGAKKIITLAASHASLASVPIPVCALIDEAAKASSA